MHLLSTSVIFAVLCVVLTRSLRRTRRSPPGPRKYPVIGNLLSARFRHPWVKYHELSIEHESDILHIEGLGVSAIILNSREAANDLLVKRPSLYSSRPRLPMLNEILDLGWAFVFSPSDELWRQRRKVFMLGLSPNDDQIHQPNELRYARNLLKCLLSSPAAFLEHSRFMASAINISTGYGFDVKPQDDPFISLAERAMHAIATSGNFGYFWVDHFPFLRYIPKWFPGATFQKLGAKWKEDCRQLRDSPFQTAKMQDSMKLSFTSKMLARYAHVEDEGERLRLEELVADAAGNLYGAMVLYPGVQREAQQELDIVLGGSRLPEFNDKASLPYITSIVYEVLRWSPIVPLGGAHLLEQDDEYKGYFLKKGSVVLVNIWSILRDEKDYSNPSVFDPSRFMKGGSLDPDVREPTPAFGFGPRVCPGKHVATSTLWITVASVLSTMTISPEVDGNGVPILPRVDYEPGLICHPAPFKCMIMPRSKDAEVLILAE